MIELWKGLLFGFILSLMMGPVFFALIQTSIEKGFKAGAFMALGISISDSLYIVITYSGISVLSNNDQLKIFLGIAGAIIMIIFGVNYIMKPVPKKGPRKYSLNSNNLFKKIIKGFLLNTINPFVFIFWLGVAGFVTIEKEYSLNQTSLFYIGIIAMVLTADITKSFLSHKLREIITSRFMMIMNRVVGIALILFGFRLLYYVFEMYHIL